jgi:hypothetical protein
MRFCRSSTSNVDVDVDDLLAFTRPVAPDYHLVQGVAHGHDHRSP